MLEDLINASYEYEKVDYNKYDFISKGDKDIPKRVSITQYPNKGLENYFNLGFGNITISDDGDESISDMTRDNNKLDRDRVLKTVFTCSVDFLSNNPNAIITFYGNTSAKHRIYKIGINNNLSSISEFFHIKGGIIHDLQIEETREKGKIPISQINVQQIEYQVYDPNKSNLYNFITFELKQEYK
ncbi:hypothetical protein [Myroides sp. DF42-4-2]|uniref:DUF6934 family protein n=1 Tax=Myroides sp. DF42-4-2 TaxID=2746726 RepID=UPI0025749006|nr:hypothetical protein [Myroides sp. DF42-4-2]MDM1408198.1 hypothetical protein [Myroides sp. DF42-4-2]